MNDQQAIDFNAPGLVRNDHPDTAQDAADNVLTGKLRRQVYNFLIRRGGYGATDEELIDAMGGEHMGNAVRPRRVELVRSGHAYDSDIRRKVRSGRSAIVWMACPDIEEARPL